MSTSTRSAYEEAAKGLDEVLKINPRHPLAFAYLAVLGHLENEPEKEQKARSHAQATWRENPEVDHLIGRKLSQKYRFAEGEKYQRKALAIDPKHLRRETATRPGPLAVGERNRGLEVGR